MSVTEGQVISGVGARASFGPGVPGSGRARRRRYWWERSQSRWGLTLIAPSIVILFVFTILPILGGLALSFTRFDLARPPQWVGLANYVEIFSDDLFWRAAVNTLYFTAGTLIPGLALALSLALIATRRVPGVGIFRTIFYLPGLSSSIAVSVLWLYLFSTDGLVNGVLHSVGIPRVGWFTDPAWAMPTIILNSLWIGAGGTMLVYIAGLNGIPQTYYEAAWMDGATRLQTFRYITLPLLQPTTFLLFVTHMLGSFQVFAQILVMTEGGPAWSTTTIVHQIYINAFLKARFGYAGAQAVGLLLFLAGLTYLSFRSISSTAE